MRKTDIVTCELQNTNQPTHLCILISAFVVCSLKSILTIILLSCFKRCFIIPWPVSLAGSSCWVGSYTVANPAECFFISRGNVFYFLFNPNARIASKVVCFTRLLKCLRSLYGKQCGPRSDCSYRSSLFWVHVVCLYALFFSNVRQLFAADDFSRRHFRCIYFLGALRVKPCLQMYLGFLVCLNVLSLRGIINFSSCLWHSWILLTLHADFNGNFHFEHCGDLTVSILG